MPGRFYTAKGDDGTTGLLGEGRAAKNSARIEAVGAVDEAGSALGLARSQVKSPETPGILLEAQRDLYRLMAELAATQENAQRFRVIGAERVAWLEEQAARVEQAIEVPREFLVPGDTVGDACLDLARTAVRRAERRVAALVLSGEVENRELLRYLNRLSSLVYLLELAEIQSGGSGAITFAKVKD